MKPIVEGLMERGMAQSQRHHNRPKPLSLRDGFLPSVKDIEAAIGTGDLTSPIARISPDDAQAEETIGTPTGKEVAHQGQSR